MLMIKAEFKNSVFLKFNKKHKIIINKIHIIQNNKKIMINHKLLILHM
jgi:hypothetical protein